MADVAALVFDIDSTSARTAVTDLAKVQNASSKLAGEWSKTDAALRKSNGQWASSVDVVNEYGDEVRRLAREFNPALNAVYEFQNAEERLNRAVGLGVVTLQEKAATLDRVKVGLAAAAEAQIKFGNASAVATHHATNLGYQLNDIGMMMSLGQNPFALMMQQGPQVAQIFSQMNAEGRKIGPTLASAFTSMLNPTTAVTMAVIAGSAALVQWGMSAFGAGDDTKTFDDSVASAESAISNLSNAVKTLSGARLGKLADGYGVVNAALLVHLERLEQVAALEAMASNRNNIIEAQRSITGGWLTTDLDDIRNALGITNDATRHLIYLLDQVKAARTFESQAASITKAREYLNGLGITLEKSEGAALLLLTQLIKAEDSAFKLRSAADGSAKSIANATSQTSAWASAMSSVLSYVNAVGQTLNSLSSGGINLAAIRTETALLQQGKSLRDASFAAAKQTIELEGKARALELKKFGVFGEFLASRETTQKTAILTAQQELDLARETAREREKSAAGGGVAGGGGAALEAAEKQFQNIRELLEKESVFQIAEWEKRQAQLDQALAKNLLSETTYQTMKQQLQMVYFGMEFEQKQVQYQMDLESLNAAKEQQLLTEEQFLMRRNELNHKYSQEASAIDQNATAQQLSHMSQDFAQMNALAGGGYDGLLKLQRSFAAAAALINTYKAYTDVLASGAVLSPWAKLAWGAKILAAGMGAVNAIKGGGSGGSSAGSTSTASPTKQEPTKNIMVRLEGPDYMVDMAESIMQQIYEQSNSGRVIISRDR